MIYFTDTTFMLAGKPQGNKHDFWNAGSEQEAIDKAARKYQNYGAEFGSLDVVAMTLKEKLSLDLDHLGETYDLKN